MLRDVTPFRGEPGRERARAVIERMAALGIPTTPANYEVWVAHCEGWLPELSREIEAHARGERFSDEINEDLHERYFANTRLSVRMLETSESISRELNDAASTLRGAGVQAGSYASELQSAIEGLQTELDPSTFRGVIARLGMATQEAAEHSRDLAERMQASSRQIEQLRTALQAVKIEALTDALTGLANRKMFDEALRNRLAEASAGQGSLCLLVFDIDDLSRVNDAWGQLIGDQVIRYAAAVVQAHAKGDALAARLSGGVFAMIMPRTELHLAEALAARVNRAVKGKQLTRKSTGDVIGAITMSIGAARHNGMEAAIDLLGRADRCARAAKRAGGDCSVTETQLARASAAA